jgi:hypothetical protein
MSKKVTSNVLISVIISIIITGIMFVVPVQKHVDGSYADAMSKKTYGFPLQFKTTSSGGIAGNINSQANIHLTNLILDFVVVASVAFIVTMLLARQRK